MKAIPHKLTSRPLNFSMSRTGQICPLGSLNNVFWELTNQFLLHPSFQPIPLPRMAVVSIHTAAVQGLHFRHGLYPASMACALVSK